jgi:hypothetical protein
VAAAEGGALSDDAGLWMGEGVGGWVRAGGWVRVGEGGLEEQ